MRSKMIKTDVAKKIFRLQKLNRFAFDIEILWLAKKLKFKNKRSRVGVAKNSQSLKLKFSADSLEMFFSVAGLYKRQLLGR